LKLRSWQQRLLDEARDWDGGAKLIVASPGAGKTTATAALISQHFARHPPRRRQVIVICPSTELRFQWADSLAAWNIHLNPEWSGTEPWSRDYEGVSLTYAGVSSSATELVLRKLIRPGAVVVLDEVHHAAEQRSWGDALAKAFRYAGLIVALSGTPFRSDGRRIPFIRYDDNDVAAADFEYSYGHAVHDRICRPVNFHVRTGDVQWFSDDEYAAHFDDDVPDDVARQRLRAALAPDHEHVRGSLADAHERLTVRRETETDAAGLAICIDAAHARAVAAALAEITEEEPELILSAELSAHERLRQFRTSEQRWVVSVRMISEGIDIPRLGVLVMLTTVRTELHFRQAVGRVIRTRAGQPPESPADVFLLGDPAIRRLAEHMEEEQRPGLKPIRMDPSDVDPLANGGRREVITMDSTSERDGLIIAGVHYMPDEVAQAQKMLDFLPAGTDIAAILQGLRATATHTRAPSTATEPRAPAYQETAALKKELNHLVTAMVKARAYLPGYDQREANREVNEKIGVYTRKNASAEQLKLGIEYCTATLRQLREELRTS
jgi:superfamily II DNA or RNA helicase